MDDWDGWKGVITNLVLSTRGDDDDDDIEAYNDDELIAPLNLLVGGASACLQLL